MAWIIQQAILKCEAAPLSGKPAKYDEVTVKRVLELLDRRGSTNMDIQVDFGITKPCLNLYREIALLDDSQAELCLNGFPKRLG